jgi:hypothetical protein
VGGGAEALVTVLGVDPVVGGLLRPTVVGPAEGAQGGVLLARGVEGGGPVEGVPRPGGSLCGKLEVEGEPLTKGFPKRLPLEGVEPEQGALPNPTNPVEPVYGALPIPVEPV